MLLAMQLILCLDVLTEIASEERTMKKTLVSAAMKKTLVFIVLMSFACLAQPVSELKVLAIGNSFSVDAYTYLAQIISSHGKAKAVLGNACIGGCSFQRHWEEHLKSEADPNHKPYRYTRPETGKAGEMNLKHWDEQKKLGAEPNQNNAKPGTGKPEKMSLKDYLTAEKWDVVTIQSVSSQSFKPELWQPYADNLIALIRELAPQARIMIHRTWAYRPDHPWFRPGKELTPQIMFDKSKEAYETLAKKHRLALIPAGDAMWIAYKEQPVKHIFPDPDFDYKNPVFPKLPKDDGALITGYHWAKNKTGERVLRFDGIHANVRGDYLLGCTWYAFLFRQNLDDLTFAPKGISPEDAKFLRGIAQRVAGL